MTIRKLLPPNDTALMTEADTMGVPLLFMDQHISDLYETLYFNNALGLAAPQVGILQKLAVMDVDDTKLTLINPEIIEASEEMVESKEGCLSCPGIEVTLSRHKEITIKNYRKEGGEDTITLTGQAAITAQHEIDHLNGILITYRLSSLKKHHYKRQVKRWG
jgi:peptide deformylase